MRQGNAHQRWALLLGITITAAASANTQLGGVNLAGAEFGSAVPGTINVDYAWPSNAELDYFRNRGMNVVRVPFLWESPKRARFSAPAQRPQSHATQGLQRLPLAQITHTFPRRPFLRAMRI